MNLKLSALLIVGLFVGGGAGLLLGGTISASVIDDLTLQNAKLTGDYTTLNATCAELNARLASLDLEKTQLLSRVTELQAMYDKLSSEYESTLASVPVDTAFSSETVSKSFTWSYAGDIWSISLSVPESLYTYYKDLARAPTSDYSIYVTHPYDDEYLGTIVEKFNLIAVARGLSEAEKVNLVVAFVQSLPYTVDSVTTGFDEYPRYPVETLVDGGGDCEDTSILAAALLHTMNYDVILINPPVHFAIGVNIPGSHGYYWSKDDVKYYYVETTGEGWTIGELPPDYVGTKAMLFELKPIPILTHSWTSHWSGSDLILSIKVRNVGTATATGYHVEAGLDAGGGQWRNVQSSDAFSIAMGKDLNLTLTVKPTKGYHTRIIVCVVSSDGISVDKSYSEWFDI